MSEETKTPVEQTIEPVAKVEDQNQVAYETYKKTVESERNAKAKLSSMEQKLQALEEEKLQREGKKDELLTTYKTKLAEIESKYNKTQQSYAWNTLTGEIKREAMNSGCLDPDKLIKLMNDEDLNSIEVGENFNVDRKSVKEVIERSKKENAFLFSQGNKVIANGNPTTKPVATNKVDINNMSWDEAKALAKTLKD